MKICGHELGRKWFFEIRTEIKWANEHIKELETMRADMMRLSPENDHIKRAAETLDKLITDSRHRIETERQNLKTFTDAVKSLPDNQKQFAKLHYIDGKTIEETAELMCYSVGGLHRIRRKAEKGIEEYISRIKQSTANKTK